MSIILNHPVTHLVQVGNAVVVMARVLGLLWMRNPLTILYQEEQKAAIPACTIRGGRQQPQCSKKGDALLPAAQLGVACSETAPHVVRL